MFVFDLLCINVCPFWLKRKRKLVALLLLSYRCLITINVQWLYLTVPWVGLQCVIVVVPDHTHFVYRGVGYQYPISLVNMLVSLIKLATVPIINFPKYPISLKVNRNVEDSTPHPWK